MFFLKQLVIYYIMIYEITESKKTNQLHNLKRISYYYWYHMKRRRFRAKLFFLCSGGYR